MVSPLDAVVEVGTHAAAFAGVGIETKRLVTKTVERTNAIFFTRPKIGSPESREPKIWLRREFSDSGCMAQS
ncbi:unannotated protein [freshwater metagenome]|uniref:Unannotated protein n=1 Tax=freshwater metagenome TaxID=449393 RepID=A0A6J7U4B7_9ZZZZ